MLITRAEVDGIPGLDVRVTGARVVEVGPDLGADGAEPRLDAAGGALLPGLHDHHLHLLAMAAAEASIACGPPEVRTEDALARALDASSGGAGWIRGTGYHESVAGELDRTRLDAWLPDRPLRIQHRSGALWMLNSVAVDRLRLDRGVDAAGVERGADGRATGRLFRLDGWLRERLGTDRPPSLRTVSRRLAEFGVTGVTDATAGNSRDELRTFTAAAECGDLLQRVVMMGRPELPSPEHPALERGPVKVLLDERELPNFDELVQRIEEAHDASRAVAVHCVTHASLVLATAAFAAAGARAGDRIEHAAVAPPQAVALLARLPLTVVTQPHFVRERGDAYLADVDARDRPWLYRCRGFTRASVPLGAGTDAPFGNPDPWRCMRAAMERRTESGRTLGVDEGLDPEEALALFTTPPLSPGGPPRSIRVGAPADLCLLDQPWSEARRRMSSEPVVATIRAGAVVWQRV